MAGVDFLRSLWERTIWEGVWPHLNPMDRVRVYAQHPRSGTCQGRTGRTASSFFFLIQKEPAMVSGSENVSPFFNGDIRTPLLLCGCPQEVRAYRLALIAEEGRDGDGCHVPGLGDEWKMVCPKSPMWESEGEAWSEDERVSSSGSREGNVGNDALHVIGLYGPGDKISLFLKDWELAKVALSCHMALDMLCREVHEAWWWGDATERPAVT